MSYRFRCDELVSSSVSLYSLLSPTVTALQTHLEVCRAYAGPHDFVCNTAKQYVCWCDQSNHRVGTQQRVRLGNEDAKERSGTSHSLPRTCHDCRVQAAEMIRILKKQFRRQNAFINMLVRNFSFAPIESKISLFKSYYHPIYGCDLWRHSFQNSFGKFTVSYL